ncbi:MAG: hypothetical protein WAU91_00970, partial [Desulfatitalea sp.]
MRKSWLVPCINAVFIIFLFPSLFSNLFAATEDYAGAYTCTFSGGITGIAIVHVSTSGSLEGVIWSEQQQTVDYVAGWASVDENGIFSFVSYCGMQVDGSISTEGAISGSWVYQSASGSLAGEKDNGSLDAYAGSYSGTFSGDYTGTWSAGIDSEGIISGEFQRNGQSGTDEVNMGMIDSAGNMIMISYEDISAKGEIDGSGAISGVWNDGTYSGTYTTAAASSSSSGGGG